MTISGPIGDYTEERVKEYLSVMVALGQTISKQMGGDLINLFLPIIWNNVPLYGTSI